MNSARTVFQAVAVLAIVLGSSVPAEAGESSTRYPLLSPLVEIRDIRANLVHLSDLRATLVNQMKRDGTSESVSIFVEDLNSGTFLGINEREPMHLASLLKVGLMIAWYKLEEARPGTLDEMLTVTPLQAKLPNDRYSRLADSPVAAGQYRVRELIEKMIVNSDNPATEALTRPLGRKHIQEVYDDLGLPNPYIVPVPDGDPHYRSGTRITAKQYSQIMKALYNSSYLDEDLSNEALRLLTRTRMTDGIRKSLAPGVPAALKYGLFSGAVYESGIVYLPGNTYLVTILAEPGVRRDHSDQLEWIRRYAGIVHRHFAGIRR